MMPYFLVTVLAFKDETLDLMALVCLQFSSPCCNRYRNLNEEHHS